MDPITSSATANSSNDFPFCFSILNHRFPMSTESDAGGPILGAIICVSMNLQIAAEKVSSAGKSLRAKAEALQFLTCAQKAAYCAACSVAAEARKANAPVIV